MVHLALLGAPLPGLCPKPPRTRCVCGRRGRGLGSPQILDACRQATGSVTGILGPVGHLLKIVRPAIRICCFSQNQWRLEEELCPGALRESSFYKALMAPSCQDGPRRETLSCFFRVALPFASRPHTFQGTGMMMDSELTPLKRSASCLRVVLTRRALEPAPNKPRDACPFASAFRARFGGRGVCSRCCKPSICTSAA